MSWRRMAKTNILVLIKTSSGDVWLRRIYFSWSRPLQDVFWSEGERRLHQDECLLGFSRGGRGLKWSPPSQRKNYSQKKIGKYSKSKLDQKRKLCEKEYETEQNGTETTEVWKSTEIQKKLTWSIISLKNVTPIRLPCDKGESDMKLPDCHTFQVQQKI